MITEGCMGAEATRQRLLDFDLQAATEELLKMLLLPVQVSAGRALKRLKVVTFLRRYRASLQQLWFWMLFQLFQQDCCPWFPALMVDAVQPLI